MNFTRHGGFSLIEILVTIVILMVGLLGLAGLQGFALTSQMESYQRSQALILLQDMKDRINANRKNAADYIATVGGVGATCPAAGATVASNDLNAWCNALMGTAEVSGGGTNVGAMIGAKGCISQVTAPTPGVPGQYLVAVAWQGLNSTVVPSIACGSTDYGNNDAMRRVIALPISIADLN